MMRLRSWLSVSALTFMATGCSPSDRVASPSVSNSLGERLDTALVAAVTTPVTVTLSSKSVQPAKSTKVTVKLQPAVSGRTVYLSVAEVVKSGGHAHTGRPLGSFSTSSGKTNSSGEFSATYTASPFGGVERITATIVPNAAVSVNLDVAVPSLAALPSNKYYDNHWGETATHPASHYGTSAAIAYLKTIAAGFAAAYRGSTLRYNDMSLAEGGLFDWKATWSRPHDEHRSGRNADVSMSNVPSSRRATLERLFIDNGSPNFLRESDHWHLRF